jgi:phospholipid/cholesterol/gamma-HCH transport system ATP-binding protein
MVAPYNRAASEASRAAISVTDLVTRIGAQTIHDRVTFSVQRGVVAAIIGSSGCGKSVLLRELVGLMQPTAGNISLLGSSVRELGGDELSKLRRRVGMLFQFGALFSALSVYENIALPLREFTCLSERVIREVVSVKSALAGFPIDSLSKRPSQLSGGMVKRAALARALALDPELLLLDEPTSGLDPITARRFDDLIATLSHTLGLSVLMVTHDLDSLFGITQQLVVLTNHRVAGSGSVREVAQIDDPWIQEYFSTRSKLNSGAA